MNIDSFLNVVGEMKVTIVEEIVVGLRLYSYGNRRNDEGDDNRVFEIFSVQQRKQATYPRIEASTCLRRFAENFVRRSAYIQKVRRFVLFWRPRVLRFRRVA